MEEKGELIDLNLNNLLNLNGGKKRKGSKKASKKASKHSKKMHGGGTCGMAGGRRKRAALCGGKRKGSKKGSKKASKKTSKRKSSKKH